MRRSRPSDRAESKECYPVKSRSDRVKNYVCRISFAQIDRSRRACTSDANIALSECGDPPWHT